MPLTLEGGSALPCLQFREVTSGDITEPISGPISFILDGEWLVSTYDIVIFKLIRLSTIAESIFMTKKLGIP